MSNFNPPPSDGNNYCGDAGCGRGKACFIYNTGAICQPFNYPRTYPVIDPDATIADPPGWYIFPGYPSIRYTGPLTNQTLGANCTTIPVPLDRGIYVQLVNMVKQYDFGWFLDDMVTATWFQYRGNCAEGYYCKPNNPNDTYVDNGVQGNLPGTCLDLKAPGEVCSASTMCLGWHIRPNGSYGNDQARCLLHETNGTYRSTCTDINVKDGSAHGRSTAQTSWTYLISTLVFVGLAILYLWYRRQKMRQRQMAIIMSGERRNTDNDDNGELPAYGMHRRDERVTGPAVEEIGMYAFSNGGPPPPPMAPNAPYPPTIVRPVNQSYPFPMTHPGLNSVLNQPQPPGALYPPPSPVPAPLTAQEAEAAAIRAAAAAAMPTPSLAAAHLPDGGILPPAYEPSPAHSTTPSVAGNTPGSESSAATDTTIVNTAATGAAPGTGTGEVASKNDIKEGKQEFSGDDSLPLSKEKSSFVKEADQASTSSSTGPGSGAGSGSGSGSGSSSTEPSISESSPKNKEQ
ncbi:hypothetical protein BGZ51_007951 [Haplosporangium sp. Z 767]|nr:hypothetical protein BGZ51_007951 [Haplosporangium sp. Z 767]